MSQHRKRRIHKLLKGIETGDPDAVQVIHPDAYIQHNPQTHEGREGLAALFARLSTSSPRVNLVRVFSDGDYVFAHTEYDFATRRIGFEVFRFEGEFAVEHWDNIQPRRGPNASGRSMVDGPTETLDHDKAEQNRARVRKLVTEVLVESRFDLAESYFQDGQLIQHDPALEDGLRAWLATFREGHSSTYRYQTLHRVLADGNFVLTVSEGTRDDVRSAFYDLFRVEAGHIAEHWNTIEAVAPAAEWKNTNGKF